MLEKTLKRFTSVVLNKHLLYNFVLGLSLVFAYAPFALWWLPFLIIPIWLQQLYTTSSREVAKRSYAFSLGWFASGIGWVHVSIEQFGGMPLFASLLLMLVLCMYLAIYPALAAYLAKRLSFGSHINLWLLPATWMILEYLRGIVLTGFPWLSFGYTQIDGPLVTLAPYIGEIGLTFVVVLLSVVIVHVVTKTHFKLALAVSILAIISFVNIPMEPQVKENGKSTRIALVQGNVKQELKWEPEMQWPTMLKYMDLARTNYDADVIVWPESAIPAFEPLLSTQEFLDMADRSASLNKSAIITGIINYQYNSDQYFNALIVLGNKEQSENVDYNESGESYYYNNSNRYYKNHLLPIGEFVPFEDWLRPVAPFFNLPNSSFSRGDYIQPNLQANGHLFLPLICFEIAFPHQLAANFSEDTDFLLTVSNDAWFGNSHGPHQHMEIARMRAIEFGRPLVRATNTGVTAIVDHQGKMLNVAPQFQESVIKSDVAMVEGRTTYSLYWPWIQFGLPFFYLGLCLIITSLHYILVTKRAK